MVLKQCFKLANFQVDCVEVRMSHTLTNKGRKRDSNRNTNSSSNGEFVVVFEFKLKNFLCGNTSDAISCFTISVNIQIISLVG